MKNLIWDEALKLYRTEQVQGFDYLDGGEDQILTYLNSISDKSIFSEEVKKGAIDWPSYYHFSIWRHNIMRPVKLGKGVNVLEVGAGCGAITRYMGESGANVVAVEGEIKRARSIRQRCEDLDNVSVCWANVFDIEFESKFDILTLIGVFEYSGRYAPFDKPFLESLEKYRDLLSDNGKIVIAIENRMGLKYFCGYNEDHFGKPYLGIEDRYGEFDVNTFGKKEIKNLIEEAGFEDVEFYYPYPDYKFPQVILSQGAIENDEFNTGDLISGLKAGSYSGVFRTTDMNYEMVCKMVAKNGLEADLSNSFLIIANKTKSTTSSPIVDSNLLAVQFNYNRHAPYHTMTNFEKKGDEIIVRKSKVTEVPADNAVIKHELKDSPYFAGRNLAEYIKELVFKGRKKELEEKISLWVKYIVEQGLLSKGKLSFGSKMKSDFYDAIPQNLILDKNGHLFYFDDEWELKQDVSLGFILYRGLKRIYLDNSFFKGHYGDFISFYNTICGDENIGIVSKNQLKEWEALEGSIQALISSGHFRYKKMTWYRLKIDMKYKLKLIYKMVKKKLDI